jgi:hypothetical protein
MTTSFKVNLQHKMGRERGGGGCACVCTPANTIISPAWHGKHHKYPLCNKLPHTIKPEFESWYCHKLYAKIMISADNYTMGQVLEILKLWLQDLTVLNDVKLMNTNVCKAENMKTYTPHTAFIMLQITLTQGKLFMPIICHQMLHSTFTD